MYRIVGYGLLCPDRGVEILEGYDKAVSFSEGMDYVRPLSGEGGAVRFRKEKDTLLS
jgi:hypothetical protein